MITSIAYRKVGRDGHRDQTVTCDMGVLLHSKAHPFFMIEQAYSVLHTRACFLCFFYNPYNYDPFYFNHIYHHYPVCLWL